MKRRKFIGIIGIGSVAIVTGSYISFSSFDEAIERIIIAEADALKLKVDKKEILSFISGARDAGIWDAYSFKKKELIKWISGIENLKLPLLFLERYKWYKKEVFQQFLFASSFFYDGMDESKPIRYLRIYDPYSTPCCNPFSNLYYP